MVDYVAAIKRPFSDFKKLGIGALLYFVPILNIITGLFASGYSLVCAKTANTRDFRLPEWKNWGDLFVKGLLAFVISMVYFIPTAILVAIFLGTAIMRKEIAAAVFSFTGGIIIAILVALLTIYVLPSAIVSFAINGNFGAAFSGKVFRNAFTGKYLATWLVLALYSIAIGFIASLLSIALAVTIVLPWAVMAFANIILSITALTAFGELYSEIK